jgi:ceramide glucosyltransferase
MKRDGPDSYLIVTFERGSVLPTAVTYLVLLVATFPLFYYAISIFSIWRFFRRQSSGSSAQPFTPPVSNIKPIRGFDPDSYENFASLCRQDYPQYELLFCVGSHEDPAVPIVQQLIRDFPERDIRIIYGSGRTGVNDKVAKLARLASEAKYEVLVINDSDVRVQPDYFRTVVAPLQNPAVGAVTCLYVSTGETNFTQNLQMIGMISDFFPSILVARQLDGVKFALGTTIATTRSNLRLFGGYESLENRPADDLLVGRLIAEQGLEVELLSYAVETVPDYASLSDLFHKRLRWIVVMRHMRPAGHFGLIFTHGLPWAIAAVALHPTVPVVAFYLGAYTIMRSIMTVAVGRSGLGRKGMFSKLPLIPLWDTAAFGIWLFSFTRSTIRWRDGHYHIVKGQLVKA